MKKVLLIEDDTYMRENTAEILTLARFDVIKACNGKEGVSLAQTERPDLIICDIMMPELDGYGVLHLLSKDESTSWIPFIFVTAKAEREDLRKGMSMGADDYLTKPYDDRELLDVVETRLRKNDILKTEFAKSSEGVFDFFNQAKESIDLKHLSLNKSVKLYKKKEPVYLEGSLPNRLFLIKSGQVKTSIMNDQGKEFVTGIYSAGDFVGYNDLLEDISYTDSCIALKDSELIIIPKADFFSLLFSSKDIAGKFIKMLSNNVKSNEVRLAKLAYNSVRKRVADALLMLIDKQPASAGSDTVISISREDLASIVGTASETVIRTLSDFKEEQLITVSGSKITILNEAKLRDMKN
ncbi:MAG: response regulator [Bacteroidota bacterium]